MPKDLIAFLLIAFSTIVGMWLAVLFIGRYMI